MLRDLAAIGSTLAVLVAGTFAAWMAVSAGDWFRLSSIAILVALYIRVIDLDIRRH
jgi:hypothetical protein